MDENDKPKPMGQVIQIDEARIRDHLGEMVRGTVEEALNAMLDAEADRLCGAGRYERSEGRKDTRAGSYGRSLDTKAGPVKLRMPKHRRQTFETAVVGRCQRRESSAGEALIEMVSHQAAMRSRPMANGRGIGKPGRGHHRGTVGHPGQSGHGVEPEQEDPRQDRRMAAPTDRGRSLVCPRRYRDEAASH